MRSGLTMLARSLFCFLMIVSIIGGVQRQDVLAATSATTYYVNAATGNDTNGCLSPVDACQTINQAISLASTGDTIEIAAGTYAETVDVNKGLILTGADPATTIIDGGNIRRGMQIAASGSDPVTVSGLTIQNANYTTSYGSGLSINTPATLNNVIIRDNVNNGFGGGGMIVNSTANLNNVQVLNNEALIGGGILVYSLGNLTLTDSLIDGNSAAQGGGIYVSKDATISGSTISNNDANQFGGGIAIFGSTVSISASTFTGNSAGSYGAGILNNVGSLTLTNSTVATNTAPEYSGVTNISPASMVILNSTIADNLITSAGIRYGGVANLSGGTLSIQNSIVANNDGRQCTTGTGWTSLGNNIASDTRCDLTGPNDLPSTDPMLSTLGYYGVLTQTFLLMAGSPAIDSANPAACPPTDQRGVTRPVDGDNNSIAVCDRGAVETRSQLSISDVQLTEGDSGTTTATFTVSLAPTSSSTVTVDYATANGSAVAGSDYTATSGMLTFTPGQSSQPIQVTIQGDTSDENDETFTVTLSNATNVDLLDAQATGTILDDDGLGSLTIDDVSITEGNTGTSIATFTVTLSPSAPGSVTVDYATQNGSASSGSDYVAKSGTLTFTSGQTTRTIEITVNSDLVDEGTSETFTVNLSNPSGAVIADSNGTGTINDDDVTSMTFGTQVETIEGDTGQTDAIFSVTLSTPAAFTITVDYSSSGGIGNTFATAGVDFVAASGTLTFAPGETQKSFAVQIIGDTLYELDERFSVLLSNANVSITANANTGIILNDDDALIYLPMLQK